jgi:hypothetical protein
MVEVGNGEGVRVGERVLEERGEKGVRVGIG